MSDTSDGLGGAPAGPNQTERAQANASKQQGNGRLLAPRSGRDVSRPWAATMKRGSSTRDQCGRSGQ
jgi:hypothetical protein